MPAAITSTPPARGAFVDKELHAGNGYVMLGIALGLIAVFVWLVYGLFVPGPALVRAWIALPAIICAVAVLKGLVVLQPNESLVCLLFGGYVGTEHRPGFWWVNPFNSKQKISRRLETLESGPLKVNDAVGNPIDIGAVIVWRVEDAAKALLEVGSYASYVKAQSETALRRMASVHPYDLVEAEEAVRQAEVSTSETDKPGRGHPSMSTVSLRDGGDAIIEALLHEIRIRMEPIGVSVLEARISHLAYSSEIAGTMLRKQAASAVVAARRMVVKGAVSIVEDALSELDKKKLADILDPERKAAMISNLLVVLVGDREVTPVINTGTLYSQLIMAQRGRPPGPERIAFPLRAEKAILDAVKRCAAADLRSVNAEIEILLREALARRGIRVRPADKGDGTAPQLLRRSALAQDRARPKFR